MLDSFDIPVQYVTLVDIIFLMITATIAWRGIRFRDQHGRPDAVRLLFGCIAALFFVLVLLQDVLGLLRL